ncbi:hypothetical protein GCM10010528_15240 [Gordonia defluvii]|jgi:hypothetical protein|uniref:DUF3137 domain-containing protein n=2 Tax=Gordoniaceae TaxID=85026 RepID=A0ABP6L7T0_9ACTN
MRSIVPSPRLSLALTLLTLVAVIAAQVAYWPITGRLASSLMIAATTPLWAVLPAGVVFKVLRRPELRRWSAATGFHLDEQPSWPPPAYDVAPFNIARARRKRVRTAMNGTVGAYPAWYVHYTWLNNNRINISTHYRNVFGLTLPQALPPLSIGPTISPEAGHTVEFESITFNEQWLVTCPDERFAKGALPPTTLDGLLSMDLPVTANTRIVLMGRNLLAISLGGVRGADISRLYEALRIIADGIPRHVWQEYGR